MKKFIFFILILIVCSCKKEDSKTTVLPTATSTQVNTIIYSSKLFAPHLKFNTELSEYELINLKNNIMKKLIFKRFRTIRHLKKQIQIKP